MFQIVSAIQFSSALARSICYQDRVLVVVLVFRSTKVHAVSGLFSFLSIAQLAFVSPSLSVASRVICARIARERANESWQEAYIYTARALCIISEGTECEIALDWGWFDDWLLLLPSRGYTFTRFDALFFSYIPDGTVLCIAYTYIPAKLNS